MAAGKPRGILPTYVTGQNLVLAKASPLVRETYEIRLACYFALRREKVFTLALLPDATAAEPLRTYLGRWGGEVVHFELDAYSVAFTAEREDGAELETWVLGDQDDWFALRESLASAWLKDQLQLGATFADADLHEFADVLASEELAGTNLDREPLQAAVARLVATARENNGRLFVQ